MFLRAFSLLVFSICAFGFDGAKTPFSIEEGDYHQFSVNQSARKKLGGSDVLSMTVENPNATAAVLFVVFEDAQSRDYWSRLNFKTTLAPGINELSFDLHRALGERGSVRHARGLDFSTLKKAYVVVNPEEAGDRKFIVKKIGLGKTQSLKVPNEVYAFDFAGQGMPSTKIKGIKTLTDLDTFSAAKGFGFEQIELWRKQDSQIKPDLLSSSLSVTKAVFRLSLKPGKYRFELIWDELGYWDTPFWKKRSLFINGAPKRIESRSSIRDFLKDYTSLLGEPHQSVSAYDYYLKKVFRPVEGEFIVGKDGNAIFQFEGDQSGVALNSLMIWPENGGKSAQDFKVKLENKLKAQYASRYRKVGGNSKPNKTLKSFIVPSGDRLEASKACAGSKKANIVSAKNGFVSLDLCVGLKDLSPLTYTLFDLKSGKQKISSDEIKVSLYRFRPKSIDLNHETYEIRGDQLEKLEHPSVDLNGYYARYLNIKLPNAKAGEYSGSIVFEQAGEKTSIDLNVKVLDVNYEPLPVKAGFIGLSPFPHNYFNSDDKDDYSKRFMRNSYNKLKEAGFNLFTDIPSPKLSYSPDGTMFRLESAGLDKFLGHVEEEEIFMYGGEFPGNIFTGHQRNVGQSEMNFWDNLSSELEKITARHKGKTFVYLYSDEATGYRNAVEEDTKAVAKYKKVFPSLKYGGFGNLNTWEKGSKLYKKWDYGLYSEIPSEAKFSKVKSTGQELGVYNICAEPTADLSFCFGPMLFAMGSHGIKRYFEWHAAAIHNYPGYDLDGRESDIALFYPEMDGEVSVTRRYIQAAGGLEVYRKFLLLEKRLRDNQAPGHEELKAKKWLNNFKARSLFPIKTYRKNFEGISHKDLSKLDKYLKTFFSK